MKTIQLITKSIAGTKDNRKEIIYDENEEDSESSSSGSGESIYDDDEDSGEDSEYVPQSFSVKPGLLYHKTDDASKW